MPRKNGYSAFVFSVLGLWLFCCNSKSSHDQMVAYLSSLNKRVAVHDNLFAPLEKVAYYDSLMLVKTSYEKDFTNRFFRAYFLMQAGETEQAIAIYERLLSKAGDHPQTERDVRASLALANLRLGEQLNCISNSSSESCIFPIKGSGIYVQHRGASLAFKLYKELLDYDSTDLESRWLLNLVAMSLGEYPENVPKRFLIPNLEIHDSLGIKPFVESARGLGVDRFSMSGGSIVEDFDLDGYLDIVTSSWSLNEPLVFYRNNRDHSFTDRSKESHIGELVGGLNLLQTDYNNDGYPDIFVLRGGWMGKFGEQPNSLLKNEGDGTFTDVTIESGLFSLHPTQTATWNDFNRDGWLDVFIGNENNAGIHPCELFINQGDGTFINMAEASGTNIFDFVKGVTSGDYDNDGWQDIFVSTMGGRSYLLRNMKLDSVGNVLFEDVTAQAGLDRHNSKTLPTWFWDYDNDGWLDIFICSYEFQQSLAYYEAANRLALPVDSRNQMKLFHNNKDGTFTNVAAGIGLDKAAFAMGSNFGDIDNDGFLDFYLGTGNPDSKSIVPNRLYSNRSGKKFIEVSNEARVGNLQKGHGVSFADLDNDGDQDIYIQVGGSYLGDSFSNSLYLNSGYDNNWITIEFHGRKTNSFGIGNRLVITIEEGGVERQIFRDVNSGGSFGASPLRSEIGLGKASKIKEIKIIWQRDGSKQVFKNLEVNQFIRITEGASSIELLESKPIDFIK